jgi:N-acetylglucosaminyl-diphospho-decaprenol L-rhamnosyltransferase
MRASIIVVNYNGGAEAAESISDLLGHARGCDAEVIVVDNGSDDGSDMLIERGAPAALVIRESENRGYASAVNRGLREAEGAVLVVMNADVRPADGALDELVRSVLDTPEAGLVGGVLRRPNGRVTPDTSRPLPVVADIRREGFFLPPRGTPSRAEVLRRIGAAGFVPTPAISGAVMGLRRDVLDMLGPMDDEYFLYNEDVEWCRRAGRLGITVGVATGAVFEHAGGASTRKSELAAFAARVLSDFVYFCEGEGELPERVSRMWSERLLFRAWLYGADARCAILGGRSSSRERAAIYRGLKLSLQAFEWTPGVGIQSGHPSRLLEATRKPEPRDAARRRGRSSRATEGAERDGR